MLRKIYFSIVTLLLVGTAAIAQNTGGAIKVLLKDKANGETIPFANVVVYQNGVQVGVGTTDMDGYATVKPLTPGKYDVKAVYVGYQPKEFKGVVVGEAKTAYVTIDLDSGEGVKLDEVLVVEYQEPLIDPDTKSGGTVTREEYQNMATKNINSVAATTAGVFQADEGGSINVRGGRSGNTTYFVDGVKVIGGLGVPQQGVEQLSVITGGLPAQYGDATSGVISVTTRGPQSKFFGGIELISSQLTDKYGYNSIGFSVGGPILQKKDSAGNKTPMIGFFLSGQGNYEKDPDPSYAPLYKIKDDKLKELEEKPLRVTPTGDGLYPELLFVTKDDMESIKARQNVAKKSLSLNGKLDFKLAPNTNLTLGGAFDYSNGHDFVYTYMLFNTSNNNQNFGHTWRAYARINQKFGTNQSGAEKEKAQALISNAFFTFLASYEKTKSTTQDDTHKDNLFNYGYIGKFNYGVTYKDNIDNYSLVYTPDSMYYLYDGRDRGAITFERSEMNATSANYTSQAFDFRGNYDGSIFDINRDYGQLNGDRPDNINGLFSPTGRQYNGYVKAQSDQLRFTGSFSADLKNHALMAGFEYDQRNERGYTILPMGLWTRMRDYTNSHFGSLEDDKSKWVINQQFTNQSGTTFYERDYKYTEGSQKQIDKSLRELLGLDANSQVYINTDALTPDQLKLEMFSAEDLLGNGVSSTLIDYYGYDYLGNIDKNATSIDGFLTDVDEKGNKTFHVGAYKPIYVAGYIQDKFDFKDIKFNVGLRVDRFDANQKVLKDQYLFHEAYTAKEVSADRPSNIQDDYVVYVDDYNSSNPSIVGYRNTDEKTGITTWYDVEGKEVSDSKLLTRNGRINPYLKDATYASENGFSTNAFKDYVPQINWMPRVAFSFPISDVANFVAHYDVLTQRPTSAMRFDPRDYHYIYNTSNNPFIMNSNLKPEKTVDYELGYNQVLNEKKNAALKISAFYREMRSQITNVAIVNAFPKTYNTYTNQDFGTVKGLSVEFDLRRTGGVSLTANYTLQFADGSGSSANSGANLASSSQPNLRVTLPLDYDQRHNIVLNFDYRFGAGKDYKGPQFNKNKKDGTSQTIQLLQDVGANLILRLGSGTPYTRYQSPTPVGGKTNIAGTLNGSNKPWQFRADFRLDKNIELSWGKKESDNHKTANLNIYLQVLNLLNSKNVLNVYNYTGDPDDDGYIASPLGTNALAQNPSLIAFTDQYNVFLNNPGNYARPRTIRIGVMLDF